MPFLLRQFSAVSRSPTGLQDDVKFSGSTFDPVNETALETRDGGERQKSPESAKGESLFCLDDLLAQGNNGAAFFRERRISWEDGDSR